MWPIIYKNNQIYIHLYSQNQQQDKKNKKNKNAKSNKHINKHTRHSMSGEVAMVLPGK